MTFSGQPILAYGLALGIGLLIGAERERRKGVGSARAPMGIRTFASVSLLGAVSFSLGDLILLAVMAFAVAGLSVMAYRLSHEQDPGLTTEVALLLTLLLGGLSMREPTLASGVAVILTMLLNARNFLHRFVSSILSESELNDALILAAAALVLLPLAPDQYMGPFNALNPRTIWMIVILIMLISSTGYISLRVMGPRIGLPITGLTSGFVSSAATISSMGARAALEPQLLWGAVAGAVLSTVATFIQMAVVLETTSQQTLLALWLPLTLAGVTALVYGIVITLIALRQKPPDSINLGQPFSLKTALLFAATVSSFMLLAAALNQWLGSEGVIVAAAIAGFADTHSAAVAVASLVVAGKLSANEAVLPILAGLTTNTITKAVLAILSGNWRFISAIILGLILVILSAWIGAAFALGYF
ncbi:MAG: MgtC/SapB family protein [Methyloglobulus sp.]